MFLKQLLTNINLSSKYFLIKKTCLKPQTYLHSSACRLSTTSDKSKKILSTNEPDLNQHNSSIIESNERQQVSTHVSFGKKGINLDKPKVEFISSKIESF